MRDSRKHSHIYNETIIRRKRNVVQPFTYNHLLKYNSVIMAKTFNLLPQRLSIEVLFHFKIFNKWHVFIVKDLEGKAKDLVDRTPLDRTLFPVVEQDSKKIINKSSKSKK